METTTIVLKVRLRIYPIKRNMPSRVLVGVRFRNNTVQIFLPESFLRSRAFPDGCHESRLGDRAARHLDSNTPVLRSAKHFGLSPHKIATVKGL